MGNTPIQTDDYFVFISYSSKDVKMAQWLQHELERYHLPAKLNGKPRENLRKVFRDRTELSAGELGPQIEKALARSTHLVVVCSPNSAISEWVDLEIQSFIRLHKIKFDGTDRHKILPFIIEGDSPDVFSPKTFLDLQREGVELLGGDIQKEDGGLNAAFIKVVSGLLNLSFPELWDRYEREKAEEEQKERERRDNLLRTQSLFLAEKSQSYTKKGDSLKGFLFAREALPDDLNNPERPLIPEAIEALCDSVYSKIIKGNLLKYSDQTMPSFEYEVDIIIDDETKERLWEFSSQVGGITTALVEDDCVMAGTCKGDVFRWKKPSWEEFPSLCFNHVTDLISPFEKFESDHVNVTKIIRYNNATIVSYSNGYMAFWNSSGECVHVIKAEGDIVVMKRPYLIVAKKVICIHHATLFKITPEKAYANDIFWTDNQKSSVLRYLFNKTSEQGWAMQKESEEREDIGESSNTESDKKRKGQICFIKHRRLSEKDLFLLPKGTSRNESLEFLFDRGMDFFMESSFQYTVFEAIAYYKQYLLLKEQESEFIRLYNLTNGDCKKTIKAEGKSLFSQNNDCVVICNCNNNKTDLCYFTFSDKSYNKIGTIVGLKAEKLWYDSRIIVLGEVEEKNNSFENEIDGPEGKRKRVRNNKCLLVIDVDGKIDAVRPFGGVNCCALTKGCLFYSGTNSSILYTYDIVTKRKERILKLRKKIVSLYLVENCLYVECEDQSYVIIDTNTLLPLDEQQIMIYEYKTQQKDRYYPIGNDVLIWNTLLSVVDNGCYPGQDNNRKDVMGVNNKILWELSNGYLILEEQPDTLSGLIKRESKFFKGRLSIELRKKCYLDVSE